MALQFELPEETVPNPPQVAAPLGHATGINTPFTVTLLPFVKLTKFETRPFPADTFHSPAGAKRPCPIIAVEIDRPRTGTVFVDKFVTDPPRKEDAEDWTNVDVPGITLFGDIVADI